MPAHELNVTKMRTSRMWQLAMTLPIGGALVMTAPSFLIAQEAKGKSDAAAQSASRKQSMDHARQIMLAMHTHPEGFPAAAIRSADGKPLLSWRVAILPNLGQKELHQQFHLDEPWDSEHNKKLLDKMPEVFRGPTAKPNDTNTAFLAIVGQHSFLTAETQPRDEKVLGRAANAIAIVETKANIPWTKPDDLDFDPEKELPKFEGWHSGDDAAGGFIAGLVDGTVIFLGQKTDAAVLKKLLTFYDQDAIERP